jgi:hypothetical protein
MHAEVTKHVLLGRKNLGRPATISRSGGNDLGGEQTWGPVAAMLVDVPVGENPAGGTCPVATVVISGGGAGDQSAGSPEVKVSVGWGGTSGQLRQGRRASRQVVTNENRSTAPKFGFPTIESERGMWKVPSPSGLVRRPASSVKELGRCNRWTFRGL